MAKFITSLPGIGGATAAILNKHGFRVVEDIANASPEAISAVPGFRASRAAKIIAAARATLAEDQAVPVSPTAAAKKSPRAKPAPVVQDEAPKADKSEARTPKTKAPKPPKVEAPAAIEVTDKAVKDANTDVEEKPKEKTPKPPKLPKAPKAEIVKPLEAADKPSKPEKKSKDKKIKEKKVEEPRVTNEEKKAKSDKGADKAKKSK